MSESKCGNSSECLFNDINLSVNELKVSQERFEDKQDKLLELFSDYKVILLEIKNLKENQIRFESLISSLHSKLDSENREVHLLIFNRIEDIKRDKLDKKDLEQFTTILKDLQNSLAKTAVKEEVQRLQTLLENKADKTDTKETRKYLWGIVIVALSVLGGFLKDIILRIFSTTPNIPHP